MAPIAPQRTDVLTPMKKNTDKKVVKGLNNLYTTMATDVVMVFDICRQIRASLIRFHWKLDSVSRARAALTTSHKTHY